VQCACASVQVRAGEHVYIAHVEEVSK